MRRSIGTGSRSMLESLESRRLLSGNVTATATAAGDTEGTITLIGDNKSNQVEVHTDGTGYVVTGLNGTTVNGVASVFLDSTLHFRNLVASMGNGEDDVRLNGFGFNTADVKTGNGNDTVEVTNVFLSNFSADSHGDLNIDTGNGDDAVTITNTVVQGNLNVDLGNGPDSIAFSNVHVFGDTTLDGGHGPDSITGIATLTTDGTQSVIDIETIA